MHSPDLQLEENRDPHEPAIKRRLLIKVFHLNPLLTPLTLNLREKGHSEVEVYFEKMSPSSVQKAYFISFNSFPIDSFHKSSIAFEEKKILIMILETRDC